MAEWVLSDSVASELMTLIRTRRGGFGLSGPGSGGYHVAFVRCDSATATGSDSVTSQCYPATVLAVAADDPLPPETYTSSGVLLSLLGDSGTAAVPTVGAIYLAVLTGDVASDSQGSVVAGRPRAFAAAPVTSGSSVTGTGTDKHAVRWNGTGVSVIQNSAVTIDDSGDITTPGYVSAATSFDVGSGSLYSFGIGGTNILNIQHSAGSGHAIYVSKSGGDGLIYVDGGGITVDPYGGGSPSGNSGTIKLRGNGGADEVGFIAQTSIGIPVSERSGLYFTAGGTSVFCQSITSSETGGISGGGLAISSAVYPESGYLTTDNTGTFFLGVGAGTGYSTNLGPDARFANGLLISAGTGSIPGTASTNTFTALQTFQTTTSPAIVAQQTASNSSNTVAVKNSGGTVTAAITGNGDITANSYTGNGSGLTNLNASNLATGTVPSSRIGTVDGGTW